MFVYCTVVHVSMCIMLSFKYEINYFTLAKEEKGTYSVHTCTLYYIYTCTCACVDVELTSPSNFIDGLSLALLES